MDSKNTTTDETQGGLPFGAISDSDAPRKGARRKQARSSEAQASEGGGGKAPAAKRTRRKATADDGSRDDGAGEKGSGGKSPGGKSPGRGASGRSGSRRKDAPESDGGRSKDGESARPEGSSGGHPGGEGDGEGRRRRRRRRRRRGGGGEGEAGDGGSAGSVGGSKPGGGGGKSGKPGKSGGGAPPQGKQPGGRKKVVKERLGQGASESLDLELPSDKRRRIPETGGGLFLIDRGGFGVVRPEESGWRPSKDDIYVPKNVVQKYRLREGMVLTGKLARGQKHKYQMVDVTTIDGEPPKASKTQFVFKNLTSIDPDFHYACGDGLNDTSMRIVDLLCPIGRGTRGLLVAPPRSGKTTLLRTFARGIEELYPDVHLFVLLVDERPEEATEWSRSVTRGQVFASTSDETNKTHIQLAEAVWKRCMHLCEKGDDVVLLVDSMTRLARAYNNQLGSGKTMSGGLDSRAMEHPRRIFGSARNTTQAGSLTILGTILVDTGSRMDQMVFEEFKGTGNMELVLNRKLADRRVFPAIDVERSGTRKEEKLLGLRRLKQVHTLRRVLMRLHFVEAMEMLITRLDEVDKTDDFLNRFSVDPEA